MHHLPAALPVLLAPNDASLTAVVQHQHALALGRQASRIQVVVMRGLVRLGGFTDNLLSVERAAELAKAIPGVRGVISRLRVHTAEIADAVLQEHVKQALTSASGPLEHMQATVQQGDVTLTGVVNSWVVKQWAERAVKQVMGVWRVKDQLACAATAPGLTGTETPCFLDNPSEVVEWALPPGPPGSPRRRIPDAESERAIRDAWQLDTRLGTERPTLQVCHGVVTLCGTVSTVQARQAAEQDARNTVGIWQVHNHLRVWPRRPLADAEVRQSLRTAHAQDPFVQAIAVEWIIDHGRAIVLGCVPGHLEKEHLAELAEAVPGVRMLVNRLHVLDRTDPPLPHATRRRAAAALAA